MYNLPIEIQRIIYSYDGTFKEKYNDILKMSSSLNNSSSTLMIIEFSKATQNVCICLGISVIFIILFMLTPLNTFMLSSIFGKCLFE